MQPIREGRTVEIVHKPAKVEPKDTHNTEIHKDEYFEDDFKPNQPSIEIKTLVDQKEELQLSAKKEVDPLQEEM